METKGTFKSEFSDPIIKLSRATLLMAVPLSFIPALYLGFRYDAFPTLQNILTAWFMVASIYGVEYFMTPISYYPILGNAGTYLAFLSGNIANVRVPCAIVAQEAVGVSPGTEEGELVATIGMSGSIITNLIVVTIAAIAGNGILSVIPPSIQQAFDYVLPAIFGALFALFAVKYPKYAAFGAVMAILLVFVIRVLPTILMVPICSFTTIAYAIWDTKRSRAQA